MSQHWDEQALTDYSLGELDKVEAEQLELHLASCPQCRAAFNAIQDAIALLQADQWDAPPAALTERAVGLFQSPTKPAGFATVISGWLNWQGLRRQPWAAPALVGALATVAVLLFFSWRWLQEPAGAPALVQVEILQGVVELSEAGDGWQPVSGTIELKENQRIRTRNGAEALISLYDLADITLYGDSEMGLLESSDAAGSPLLEQNRGRSLHQVRARQATPAYHLQIPTYVLEGNTGTFLVEISETERRLTAVIGALQISTGEEKQQIQPGQAYFYADNLAGQLVPADPALLERFGGLVLTMTPSNTHTRTPLPPSATATGTPRPSPTLQPTDSATATVTASPVPLPTATPVPTQPPPPTATPTGDPEPTEEPEETDEPEGTEEPEETDEPEQTEEPDETEEPEPTHDHNGTEEPEPTEEPEGTEEPEPTHYSSNALPAHTNSCSLRSKRLS